MKNRYKATILIVAFLIFQISGAFAQKYKPENYGYRFLKTLYKKDTVDVVIVSKKGEELKKNRLF